MDKAFERVLYGIGWAFGLLIRWTFIGLYRLVVYGIFRYQRAHPADFHVSDELRFEHTLITCGSGWGKTQLLQHLILQDLPPVATGLSSVVVMDSQGDMIRKILRLAELSPARYQVATAEPQSPDISFWPLLNVVLVFFSHCLSVGAIIFIASLSLSPPTLPTHLATDQEISAKCVAQVGWAYPKFDECKRRLAGANLAPSSPIANLQMWSEPASTAAKLAAVVIIGLCLGTWLRKKSHPATYLQALIGAGAFLALLWGIVQQPNVAVACVIISAPFFAGFVLSMLFKSQEKTEVLAEPSVIKVEPERVREVAPLPTLSDRLILIDPNDVENPPCLNLFDFGLERLKHYEPVDRERLINGAIAMYEFMFGALLGAELTNRQGVIFRYLARLMMVVPNATIYTLMDFLENPETVRQYIPKLDLTTQRFLQSQFLSSGFDTTREQILTRLWGVLSNSALARMFSHTHNKLNLFDAMNNGSLILINTAKDLLKQEGCEIFGRFMVALISQATQERAAIAENRRLATFVYIDEAHDYFDETLEQLLNTARKYRVGIHLAHQNLGQFHRKLEQTVLASTSQKWAGGNSSDDAYQLAKEMNCEPDFIRQLQKEPTRAHFAFYARNKTPTAVEMVVPLGQMESRFKMSEAEYTELIEKNRKRVAAPYDKNLLTQSSSSVAQSGSVFDLEEQRAL
jgi:hypothetical protein